MAKYIKINENTNIYPYEIWRLQEDFPNTSFPQPYENVDLVNFQIFPVVEMPEPTHNRITETIEETDPVFLNGVWTQNWGVRESTEFEQLQAKQLLQKEIVDATQKRLDDFAKTRNYDGILSACSYVNSPTQKFSIEGQYCLEKRDETWSSLYLILSQIENGTRPIPQSFDDVVLDLPILEWPN